jgi:release factor glutamine methyltransferase
LDASDFSIEKVLRRAADDLRPFSASPELDAQILLSFVTKLDRLQLVLQASRELSLLELEQYNYFLLRRRSHEPIAYITGVKEFWGLEFDVNSAVLVPRPETEVILESFLSLIENRPDPLLLCDLGTGSGCLAIAAAFELKRRERNFYIVALDKSIAALKVARQNSIKHNVADRVQFVCSDWAAAINQSFDFVFSNPPYLMNSETEKSPELQFEPVSALYAGEEGLDDYYQILQQLPTLLVSGGVFLGEFGYGQMPALMQKAQQIMPNAVVEFHPDLRKIPRVLEIIRD